MKFNFYNKSGNLINSRDDLTANAQVFSYTDPPTGSIVSYISSTPPTSWLVCDGSAVSRSTYSNLFSIIGTTYGAGDGSTTFNLPDFKGKIPIGAGQGYGDGGSGLGAPTGTSLTNRTLGSTVSGADSVTLTSSQIGTPPHTHTFTETAHTHSVNASHTHKAATSFTYATSGAFSSTNSWLSTSGTAYTTPASSANLNASESTTPSSAAGGVINTQLSLSTVSAGGASSPHTNVQPVLILSFIIKI